MKQILMIVANNFRDEELLDPKALFEDNGYGVVIASHRTGTLKGMLTHSAEAEKDLSNVKIDDYVAVIFVGGSGAVQFFDDEQARKLARDAMAKNKIIGAICIAPSILANAGVLKDKRAAAWISEKGNLEAKGAVFTNEAVCIDGNIITANGPRAAEDFARAILKLVKK